MKGNCITTEKIPTKHEVEIFWTNIWRAPDKTSNEYSSWLHQFEMTYCSDAQPKQYELTKDTPKNAVNKIHLRGGGGYMGKYRITNQQIHPKRSKNPVKEHVHRMARVPKSL